MLSSRQGSPRRQAVSTARRGVAGAFRSGWALGCFRFHANLLHLFCRVEKAPLWLRQRCYAKLFAPRVLPMLQHGVSMLGSRGGGVSLFCARFDRVLVLAARLCVALRLQLFLRMRLRLLCLCLRAWPPCCRKCRWCCCLSRCVGVGQGPRSPPAFCRAGHRAPGGKLHVSLCRCSAFSLRANASL